MGGRPPADAFPFPAAPGGRGGGLPFPLPRGANTQVGLRASRRRANRLTAAASAWGRKARQRAAGKSKTARLSARLRCARAGEEFYF